MHRHKPRSPGVSLRGRAHGLHFYDGETSADGGKRRLRRVLRRRLAQQLPREAAEALRDHCAD